MKSTCALAVLAALAPQAAAQPAAPKPHPADPAAPVPVVKYESAFAGYRGFREEPLAPWRDVNDEVARIGGHIGIMRGAGSQAPATGRPPARPTTPAAGSKPGEKP
jgi:hypothetical protein